MSGVREHLPDTAAVQLDTQVWSCLDCMGKTCVRSRHLNLQCGCMGEGLMDSHAYLRRYWP